MMELFIVVEGPTEEGFVKKVLAPHLLDRGVVVIAFQPSTKRERTGRKHRGGGDWGKWEADIRRICRDRRPDIRVSTMFDLYGLPKNFPGLDVHAENPNTLEKCSRLEEAMRKVIEDTRFIPHVQRHEFETLVLAGLPALERILPSAEDREGLRKLKADIGDRQPEEINDGVSTAPSKRLMRFIPSYNPADRLRGEGKSFYGGLVTEQRVCQT